MHGRLRALPRPAPHDQRGPSDLAVRPPRARVCVCVQGKDTDAQNDRLQQEMELTNDLDIIMLPTIIVNGLILRGAPLPPPSHHEDSR